MQATTLIQITPYLPPAMSGVGDYAKRLGDGLRAVANLESTFIVPEVGLTQPLPLAHGRIRIGRNAQQLHATLLSLPKTAPLLLHYSGYGYHRQGFPRWLLAPLTAWVVGGGALITLFHELAASGPPWRKSFYYGPLQGWLYRRLFALSAASISTTPICMHALQALRGGPVYLAPTFSNVGEPPFTPLAGRTRDTAIVFGLRAQRAAVYREIAQALPTLKQLGIQRLLDIGPEVALPPSFDALPVESRGSLEAADVSALLSAHTFSLISYRATYLCKSGIFAASTSHSMVPLLLAPGPLPEQLNGGLIPGLHYLDLSAPLPERPLDAIGEAAYRWYAQHASGEQTNLLAALLIKFSSHGAP